MNKDEEIAEWKKRAADNQRAFELWYRQAKELEKMLITPRFTVPPFVFSHIINTEFYLRKIDHDLEESKRNHIELWNWMHRYDL